MPTRVTLLTDFGTRDGYAAAMRGVIAAIAPQTLVEDASHDVPPGDIVLAALALSRYWRRYPRGTVHVVVVDPGVGTERRALAAELDGRFLVAPDNGIITLILREAATVHMVALEVREFMAEEISRTFHGRDVFAPVAGHLANGVALERLGPAIDAPVTLDFPQPAIEGRIITGTVIVADHFGNLLTNVPGSMIPAGAVVEVAGVRAGPVRETYGRVTRGALVALVGSSGWLEIGVREGSAAERLGVGRGAAVTVTAG